MYTTILERPCLRSTSHTQKSDSPHSNVHFSQYFWDSVCLCCKSAYWFSWKNGCGHVLHTFAKRLLLLFYFANQFSGIIPMHFKITAIDRANKQSLGSVCLSISLQNLFVSVNAISVHTNTPNNVMIESETETEWETHFDALYLKQHANCTTTCLFCVLCAAVLHLLQ